MFYWFVDDPNMSRAMARARRERSEAVAAFFTGIGRGLVFPLRAAMRRFRQWRRRQRTIHELSILSDHTLKDIGIGRSEIGSVVGDLMAGRPRRNTARPIRPAVPERILPDRVVHTIRPRAPAVPAVASVAPAIESGVATMPAPSLSADQKQLTFLLNCYDVWSATPARSYPCDQEAARA